MAKGAKKMQGSMSATGIRLISRIINPVASMTMPPTMVMSAIDSSPKGSAIENAKSDSPPWKPITTSTLAKTPHPKADANASEQNPSRHDLMYR